MGWASLRIGRCSSVRLHNVCGYGGAHIAFQLSGSFHLVDRGGASMAVRRSTVYGFRMSLILIYFTALWKIESACREVPPPHTTAPVTPRPVLSRFTLSSLWLSSGRLLNITSNVYLLCRGRSRQQAIGRCNVLSILYPPHPLSLLYIFVFARRFQTIFDNESNWWK